MSYLQFDKSKLTNLEYSLSKEFIRSNRAGAYASSTIIGCNTRKYHGLLVCSCYKLKGESHIFLSTLDVSVIHEEQEFNLGIHKYQGDLYIPRGHKYVQNFEANRVGITTFNVGDLILEKEFLLVEGKSQILVKWTLVEAPSSIHIKFTPFLAFRNVHSLSKANMYVNRKYKEVKNGIMSRMYDGYPGFYMQFNKPVDFIAKPDWYYNIEYIEEQKRGYEFQEDLFVPGFFEGSIKPGESIIFSGSTFEVENPESLKKSYESEREWRLPRESYHSCLVNASEQFLTWSDVGTEIIAGFPWFGAWGRDTFISLPGLTLTTGKINVAREIIDTMVIRMKGGLFPNMGDSDNPAFNSVDAPLWFFWTLQQYAKYDSVTDIWKTYKKPINKILNAYRYGTSFNIRMLDNGLIWAGEEGKALTWMDAVISSGPVTQRKGMPVEINALWYNAVKVSLEWAIKAGDDKFILEWESLPEMIKGSFNAVYWDPDKLYLADYIDGDFKDFAVRPNMVIAAALDYSPLSKEQKKAVLDKVENELLTPKGLRTLAPKNPKYKGIYEGDQESRDAAYHQGTVWPWLLEHYAKAYLDIHKASGLYTIKKLFYGFEEDMIMHGIGTISEIYDGDPPHTPRGAISQAWSVAALLRIEEMIEKLEHENIN